MLHQSRNMLARFERWAHVPLRFAGYRSVYLPTSVGRLHALRVDGRGQGPPLVLLHGFTSAAIHYFPLMTRLRPFVSQIIALDLPAHGLSDAPPHAADAPIIHTGLREALDTMMVEPAVVFGNSLGGFAALHYALQRPERIRGLILASPAGAQLDEVALAEFRHAFHIDTHEQALDFTDRLLKKGNFLRRPLAWGIRQKFSNPAMVALIAALQVSDLFSPEQLATLTVPTRMIWGQRDLILPFEQREYFRQYLPKQVEWSEPLDYSHSPYLEHLQEVADEILAFMRRLPPPKAP